MILFIAGEWGLTTLVTYYLFIIKSCSCLQMHSSNASLLQANKRSIHSFPDEFESKLIQAYLFVALGIWIWSP
jgi:hypothetical protein